MRTALLFAALAVLQLMEARAQNAPACEGDIAVVRVSSIKPGAMQGFLSAVASHRKWYRDHGFNENVVVASRILLMDRETGKSSYSETEVLTYHVRPPRSADVRAKRDAAWDDFTNQYKATSEIKNEYVTCLPKLVP